MLLELDDTASQPLSAACLKKSREQKIQCKHSGCNNHLVGLSQQIISSESDCRASAPFGPALVSGFITASSPAADELAVQGGIQVGSVEVLVSRSTRTPGRIICNRIGQRQQV